MLQLVFEEKSRAKKQRRYSRLCSCRFLSSTFQMLIECGEEVVGFMPLKLLWKLCIYATCKISVSIQCPINVIFFLFCLLHFLYTLCFPSTWLINLSSYRLKKTPEVSSGVVGVFILSVSSFTVILFFFSFHPLSVAHTHAHSDLQSWTFCLK